MDPMTIYMFRPNLDNLKEYQLPEGYHFRLYKSGDEKTWASIETAVGDQPSFEEALSIYETEFDRNVEELKKRQLFLCTDTGTDIGTTTAWFSTKYTDDIQGLIHWVAIIPEYQAKKLGRPLLYAALKLMKTWHNRAYLCTQTQRIRAIRVYLDMGFLPLIRTDDDNTAWKIVAQELNHPSLQDFR